MYLFSQIKSFKFLFSVVIFAATFCLSFNLTIASEDKFLLTNGTKVDIVTNKNETNQQNTKVIRTQSKLIKNITKSANRKDVRRKEKAKYNELKKEKHKIEFDQTFIFKVIIFLSALATFLKILENNRFKPQFRFNTYGEHGLVDAKRKNFYIFSFEGNVRNVCSDPNSAVCIYLVLWKEENTEMTLYFGHPVESIYEVSKPKEGMEDKVFDHNVDIKNRLTMRVLPIYFLPRETKTLSVSFSIPMDKSIEEYLANQNPTFKEGKTIKPKYRFEVAIEDTAGNLFDKKGRLRNREEIDLLWTRVNHKDWNLFVHDCKIFKSRLLFLIRRLFMFIGVWK